MPYLVLYTPNVPPQRIALREPVIIGRGVGCEIWIDDTLISRHHCRLEPRENGWIIVDLDSRNGTFVDGQRITEAELFDTSSVVIGHSEMVYHSDRISDRPADPFEAAAGSGSILDKESASENSTILGQTVAGIASIDDSASPERTVDHERAVSLPFTRQPPKPIVYETGLDS